MARVVLSKMVSEGCKFKELVLPRRVESSLPYQLFSDPVSNRMAD